MPSKNGQTVGAKGVTTKREILKTIGALGIGTAATVTGSTAAAAEDTDGESVKKTDEQAEEQFLQGLRNSKEYGAVEAMITDGDFIPQFGKGDVYELVTAHERVNREGFVARVPTENTLDDGITVTIGAYASSIGAEELEIRVTATKDGRELATLYADAETIKSEQSGYRNFTPANNPSSVISATTTHSGVTQQAIPGWSDIRDAAESVIDEGQEILNGTADTFTQTADYLGDELDGAVDEAYEQAEPLFDSVELTPIPDKEPPANLVDKANELGAEHVETIDLQRECYAVGVTLTVSGAVGISMTGVGAGTGTLAILGGGALATIAGCEVLDLINTFKSDASCTFRYAYIFEETDIYGDTENWLITVACE